MYVRFVLLRLPDMNPIILLITTSLIPVGASVFFYPLYHSQKYKDTSYVKKQIMIGIVFGVISILGTELGIPINGAVMNVRDAAPLCAGLIFGGPAALIAGFIGGIERWFAVYWGAGAYTRLACTISTCLIGVITAFLKKQVYDERIPDWTHALIISIVCEVIHMLMIFVTNLNDIKLAFNFVEICSMPMIMINSMAVALSVYLIGSLKKADQQEKAKKTPYLSTQFQKTLFIVVAIGFVVTVFFASLLQTRISKQEIEDLLRLNIQDIVDDLKSQSDEELLRINRMVINDIKMHPDTPLEELLERYNIAEINIIDKHGIITRSTEAANIDFDMFSGEQSTEFMNTLTKKGEYVQEFRASTRDPELYRKYSGLSFEGNYVQVAYGEDEFENDMSARLKNIVQHRHIGETGNMIVLDNDGQLVSSSLETIDSHYDIKLNPEDTKKNTVYKAVINDEDYYYMFTTAENFRIYAVLPAKEADFSRKISTYLNQFMQSIVSGALFVAIYSIIKSKIVNNIRKVNTSLADITDGKLDTIVDVRDNREFESLSDGINTTVDSLKHFIAEANQRIDNELKYARDIQLSALPSNFHAIKELNEFDLYALMDPAKQVGGDFYDFYLLHRNTLVFLVADVAGKGIPASLFMMRAKTILKSYAENNISIADIFTNANYELCQGNDADMFVTSWMGFLNLDTGELKYVNAGHNKPLIRRKDGEFEYLEGPAGFVLGGMEGIVYKEQKLMLEPGDEIFLYTDGVVEATNIDKQLYGDDRLLRKANQCIGLDATDMCNRIKEDVDKFYEGADQFDDITELSMQFKQYHHSK